MPKDQLQLPSSFSVAPDKYRTFTNVPWKRPRFLHQSNHNSQLFQRGKIV